MKPFLIIDKNTMNVATLDGEEMRFETKEECVNKFKEIRSLDGELARKMTIAIDSDNEDVISWWRDKENNACSEREIPKLVEYPFFQNSEYSNLHFPSYSNKFPGKIAYTKSVSDGINNKRTVTSIKKYLVDYFPNSDIEELSNEFISEMPYVELFITETPEEIQHVYESGPNSCMSYSAEYFGTILHPSCALCSDDFAIAYTKNANGKINARSVILKKQKLFGKIYGNDLMLAGVLERNGFTEADIYNIPKRVEIRIFCCDEITKNSYDKLNPTYHVGHLHHPVDRSLIIIPKKFSPEFSRYPGDIEKEKLFTPYLAPYFDYPFDNFLVDPTSIRMGNDGNYYVTLHKDGSIVIFIEDRFSEMSMTNAKQIKDEYSVKHDYSEFFFSEQRLKALKEKTSEGKRLNISEDEETLDIVGLDKFLQMSNMTLEEANRLMSPDMKSLYLSELLMNDISFKN